MATLTADDRAVLRELFRTAHAKGWSRVHNDPEYAYPGSRYWLNDTSTVIELNKFGWLETPISEVECVTVQVAVDVLVAVGVLPMEMSSAHRAAEKMAYDAVYEQIKLQVADWFDTQKAPVERGWMKAQKFGYLSGVSQTVDDICDVIGVAHPEWEHMREVAAESEPQPDEPAKCEAPQSDGCAYPPTHIAEYWTGKTALVLGVQHPVTGRIQVCAECVNGVPNLHRVTLLGGAR